jgi:hypothetical protein
MFDVPKSQGVTGFETVSAGPSPRVKRGIFALGRPTTFVAPLNAALDAAAQRPYHQPAFSNIENLPSLV